MKKPYWLILVVFVVLTIWFVARDTGGSSVVSSSTTTAVTTITITKSHWSDPVTPPRFTSITYGPTEKSVKWQVMIDGVEVHTVTNDFTKVVLSDKRHVSWQWRLLPEDAKSSREFAYYFVPQGTK